MGCSSSYNNLYEKNNKIRKWKPQFDALKMTEKEIGRLYKIFRKVDVDGSGSIDLIELLVHIDVPRSRFSERVFSIFDEDGSGTIDFREFVLSLWNYCTLGRAILTIFAFDLYDTDGSGILSPEEVQHMLQDIYGKNVTKNFHAKAILTELGDMDAKADFDLDSFTKYAKYKQALLFPAFELQRILQKSTLGIGFWEKQGYRRIEVSKGKYVPIAIFMKIHLNKEFYNEVVNDQFKDIGKLQNKVKIAIGSSGSRATRKSFSVANNIYEGDDKLDKPVLPERRKDKDTSDRIIDKKLAESKEFYDSISKNATVKVIKQPSNLNLLGSHSTSSDAAAGGGGRRKGHGKGKIALSGDEVSDEDFSWLYNSKSPVDNSEGGERKRKNSLEESGEDISSSNRNAQRSFDQHDSSETNQHRSKNNRHNRKSFDEDTNVEGDHSTKPRKAKNKRVTTLGVKLKTQSDQTYDGKDTMHEISPEPHGKSMKDFEEDVEPLPTYLSLTRHRHGST